MSDMRPALKIINVDIEHDPSGLCFVTSERLPGFFLSTIDNDGAIARIESAIEYFLLSRYDMRVSAEAAEEFSHELDFKSSSTAMFAARELAEAA